MPGHITRSELKEQDLSEMYERTRTSGTKAWRAGASTAATNPNKKANKPICQIVITFKIVSIPKINASTIAHDWVITVSYTHLRAHETRHDLVCRLLLEK